MSDYWLLFTCDNSVLKFIIPLSVKISEQYHIEENNDDDDDDDEARYQSCLTRVSSGLPRVRRSTDSRPRAWPPLQGNHIDPRRPAPRSYDPYPRPRDLTTRPYQSARPLTPTFDPTRIAAGWPGGVGLRIAGAIPSAPISPTTPRAGPHATTTGPTGGGPGGPTGGGARGP